MLRLANNYPIENQFIARYPAAITVIFNSKCHTIQMVNRFHVLNAAINKWAVLLAPCGRWIIDYRRRKQFNTHLNTDGKIVFLDAFIIERMIDFYISPSVPVVRSLLQIERVKLIRLRRRTRHQPIKYSRIPFDARTAHVLRPAINHTNTITNIFRLSRKKSKLKLKRKNKID